METTRTINGIHSRCRDVGCPNPERAAYNRFIVDNKLFIIAYLVVENYLTHTPQGKQLPAWIPQGELPNVDKKDWRNSGGGQAGLREEEETIVVNADSDLTATVSGGYNEDREK